MLLLYTENVFFFNQHILLNNDYLYSKSITENNVYYINDTVNNVGGIIAHDQFWDKYGIVHYIYMYIYILLNDAIPIMWRHKLKKQNVLFVVSKNLHFINFEIRR